MTKPLSERVAYLEGRVDTLSKKLTGLEAAATRLPAKSDPDPDDAMNRLREINAMLLSTLQKDANYATAGRLTAQGWAVIPPSGWGQDAALDSNLLPGKVEVIGGTVHFDGVPTDQWARENLWPWTTWDELLPPEETP